MTNGLMVDGLMVDGLMVDGLMVDGLMADGAQRREPPSERLWAGYPGPQRARPER